MFRLPFLYLCALRVLCTLSASADLSELHGSRRLQLIDVICAVNPTACSGNTSVRTGCTSEAAANYDSLATVFDGSCTFMGCTSTNAGNYDQRATNDDGSCTRHAGIRQPPASTGVV